MSSLISSCSSVIVIAIPLAQAIQQNRFDSITISLIIILLSIISSMSSQIIPSGSKERYSNSPAPQSYTTPYSFNFFIILYYNK